MMKSTVAGQKQGRGAHVYGGPRNAGLGIFDEHTGIMACHEKDRSVKDYRCSASENLPDKPPAEVRPPMMLS